MAHRRRRIRMNPRNAKGRFIKRSALKRRAKAKANPIKRRRRRSRIARENPIKRRRRRSRIARSNPIKRRRHRRHLRANPIRRRRRLRRNPDMSAFGRARRPITAVAVRSKSKSKSKPRKRRTAKQKAAAKRGASALARWRRASTAGRLRMQVAKYRRAVKKTKKRSVQRSVALAQYHRAAALRRVIRKRGPKSAARSPLSKAMHLKTNPSLGGLIASAKVLAPQVAVGAGALIGLAMAGQKVGSLVVPKMAADSKVAPFVPALATAGLAVGGYLIADKVAPKFKGVVVIGGLLAAVVQAIAAASKVLTGGSAELATKATSALSGLGDYTLVGEYTTVGGRAYAEAGIFREVGEYTTVGEGGDNATEFARDSLRGLDDTTEFAPGEGGVLSGGLFR